MHNQIVDEIEVDEHIDALIEIINYEEPKRKLLIKLKRLSINIDDLANEGNVPFKILNLASKELTAINQQEHFRNKLFIQINDRVIKLSEIPSSHNAVIFGGAQITLSLAKILPDAFKNADEIYKLINMLVGLGVAESALKKLFGITEELDFANVLELISKNPTNGDQLAFILLYHKYCKTINLNEYYIQTIGGLCSLNHTYYVNEIDFINANAILKDDYNSIKTIFKFPFTIDKEMDIHLLEEPAFTEDSFVCENLKNHLDDSEKLSLVSFIHKNWLGSFKSTVKRINWSNIDGVNTVKILGFDPVLSVYPPAFAMPEENLPEYFINWINKNEIENDFLLDLRISSVNSCIYDLRSCLKGSGLFKTIRIASEATEKMLFNTFEWLKVNQLKINSMDGYFAFEEAANGLNRLRKERNAGELIIEDNFDLVKLKEYAIEFDEQYYLDWKDAKAHKYSIFLYQGLLPKYVTLDEINDFVFREYEAEHVAMSADNCIYINQEQEIHKMLYTLVSQDKLSSDDLLKLVQIKNESAHPDSYLDLTNRIKHLEKIIENMQRTGGRDANDITTKVDEYTNDIKEKSERQLFEYLSVKEQYYNVVWLNVRDNGTFSESWADHDFEIRDDLGNVINYIDCKDTPGLKKTFYLSEHEWDFFLKHADCYQIIRVFNVESAPNFLEIDNLLDWITAGKVVPYLSATELVKGGRVFLTIR